MELKAFVTNLGKYNEGELIGEWVTFPIDEDEETSLFERIGINEEYEEYFITDYDGYNLGEYVNIEYLNEIAERLESVDEDKLNAILESETSDFEDALDLAEDDDVILWENMTLEEVAENLMNECYEIPDYLENYIDYERFARDLSFDGFTETSYGTLEVR